MSHILRVHVPCSKRHNLPNQPFVDYAAKAGGEPNSTDAARRMNVLKL
jgi:hypothetical protein